MNAQIKTISVFLCLVLVMSASLSRAETPAGPQLTLFHYAHIFNGTDDKLYEKHNVRVEDLNSLGLI